MNTIGESIYVHVQQEKHNSIKLNNGIDLFLDSDFEPLLQAKQTGWCVLTNPSMESKGLKIGVEVLFSHLVCLDSNIRTPEISQRDEQMSKIIGVPSYKCEECFIFAYREKGGNWIPYADFVFLQPVKYDVEKLPSGIYIPPAKDYYKQIGVVVIPNNDFVVGDVVAFNKHADYVLNMFKNDFISLSSHLGEYVYRVRSNDIIARFDSLEEAKKVQFVSSNQLNQ